MRKKTSWLVAESHVLSVYQTILHPLKSGSGLERSGEGQHRTSCDTSPKCMQMHGRRCSSKTKLLQIQEHLIKQKSRAILIVGQRSVYSIGIVKYFQLMSL